MRVAAIERRRLTVATSKQVGSYRLLEFDDPDGPPPGPGQFYMVTCERGWGDPHTPGRPYLPRPMSAWQVGDGHIAFLVEAVGPGTNELIQLRADDAVLALGPLGVCFRYPLGSDTSEDAPLLVAGGVGLPPIIAFDKHLKERGINAEVLCGFRSKVQAEAAALLSGEAVFATDDGSLEGCHKGPVTDLLLHYLDKRGGSAVYACGPLPMLSQVHTICAERSLAGQLALEAPMACGFGACFGCAVATKEGYIRLCLDGPVVDMGAINSVEEACDSAA